MNAMAERRIQQARERLEQMGVIDRDGHLVWHELPPDMRPTSLTSVETAESAVAASKPSRPVMIVVSQECERFVEATSALGAAFAVETTIRTLVAVRQAERARSQGFRTALTFLGTTYKLKPSSSATRDRLSPDVASSQSSWT